MHDVFSDFFRRTILYILQASEGPVSVAELSRELLFAIHEETDCSSQDPVATQRVRTWLRCAHVLELDRSGLIVYDPEADTARLSDDVSMSLPPPKSSHGGPNVDEVEMLDELLGQPESD